jgi:iron(III) transport system permease protein
VDLRSWRWPLTLLVGLFAVMVVLVPFATILTTSLKIDVGKPLMAEGNFTFTQWSTIFSRSETMSSLKNSLVYAGVAATAGILVAITMSYLMQRTRIRGRRLPDFLITLGSGSPSVVIALGLIMSMQGRFGVNVPSPAPSARYISRWKNPRRCRALPGRRQCGVSQGRSSSPPSRRAGSSSSSPASTNCP